MAPAGGGGARRAEAASAAAGNNSAGAWAVHNGCGGVRSWTVRFQSSGPHLLSPRSRGLSAPSSAFPRTPGRTGGRCTRDRGHLSGGPGSQRRRLGLGPTPLGAESRTRTAVVLGPSLSGRGPRARETYGSSRPDSATPPLAARDLHGGAAAGLWTLGCFGSGRDSLPRRLRFHVHFPAADLRLEASPRRDSETHLTQWS